MKRREFIMKIMPAGMQSVRETTALLALVAVLTACARSTEPVMEQDFVTPTVDYVEALDVYSAPHKDSFLNQLAMNYRSYAIYNARTSGYPDIGELFANKAVAAFSGEVPFPESLDNWPVENEQEAFDLNNVPLQFFLKVVSSPADVAEKADRIITMLPTSINAIEAYSGANGILKKVKKGSLLIDSSTIDPMVSKELAKEVEKMGAEWKPQLQKTN